MRKALSVKSKLILVLLVISLGAITLTSYLSWHQSRAALSKVVLKNLSNIRAAKANYLKSHIDNLRQELDSLAESRMIISAMVHLKRGYRDLNRQLIEPEWETAIEQYYNDVFFPELSQTFTGKPDFESYRPKTQAERYLQYHYIANNPHTPGQYAQLDRVSDDNEYDRRHADYHPVLRNIANRFGYGDLLLIDHRNGDIIYSVQKRMDFATSLASGPYRDSSLARIVNALQESPEQGTIHVADFSAYRPLFAAPVAFWATTIYNGPHTIGILALQLSTEPINHLMTNQQNWQADGLDETGETYLVGPDLKMRSIARPFLEAPDDYEKTLKKAQLPPTVISAVKQFGGTVLSQTVETPAAHAALAGNTGTIRSSNYLGAAVFSSYAPVPLEGLNWGIITEMSTQEVNQPITLLQQQLLLVLLLVTFLVSLIAILFSYLIMRPVDVLSEGAKRIVAADSDVIIKLDSQDEFGRLASDLNAVAKRVRRQTKLVEKKSQESELLLQNIIPPVIAERLRRGEEQIVNHVPQASLLIARWTGVSALSKTMSIEEVAKVLNNMICAFDRVANHYNMEALRSSDERYLATCGLTISHIEHTKRTVDFGLELLEAAERINDKYTSQLGLRIGIHTGPLTASPLGDRLMYSLWGETVYIADALSVRAKPNTIVVSPPIQQVLQAKYTCTANGTMEIDYSDQVRSMPVWTITSSLKMPQSQAG